MTVALSVRALAPFQAQFSGYDPTLPGPSGTAQLEDIIKEQAAPFPGRPAIFLTDED